MIEKGSPAGGSPSGFIHVKKHGAVIRREGTEGLKPPYVMLCNHNAFLDFKVATMAIWPNRANYVVAIDGFIGREELLRQVGRAAGLARQIM